jgi:hypothetical protein
MACYRIQMCFAFSENLPKLTKTGLRHFGTATTICRQNKTISACGDVGLNRFHAIMGTYKRPGGDVGLNRFHAIMGNYKRPCGDLGEASVWGFGRGW